MVVRSTVLYMRVRPCVKVMRAQPVVSGQLSKSKKKKKNVERLTTNLQIICQSAITMSTMTEILSKIT